MKNVKRLKATTLKNYTNRKLMSHLFQVMANHFRKEPYLINFCTGQIKKYCPDSKAYFFYCDEYNREAIKEAINDAFNNPAFIINK